MESREIEFQTMFSLPAKTYRFFFNKLLLVQLILLFSAMAAIFYLTMFLYRDFYETIVQAEAVLVLKKEVSLKDVETEKYNAAEQVEKKKHESGLPAPTPDIFAPLP